MNRHTRRHDETQNTSKRKLLSLAVNALVVFLTACSSATNVSIESPPIANNSVAENAGGDDYRGELTIEAPLDEPRLEPQRFPGSFYGVTDSGFVLTATGLFNFINPDTNPDWLGELDWSAMSGLPGFIGEVDLSVRCGVLFGDGILEGDVLHTGGKGWARLDPTTGAVLWTIQTPELGLNLYNDLGIAGCSEGRATLLVNQDFGSFGSDPFNLEPTFEYAVVSLDSGEVLQVVPVSVLLSEDLEEQTITSNGLYPIGFPPIEWSLAGGFRIVENCDSEYGYAIACSDSSILIEVRDTRNIVLLDKGGNILASWGYDELGVDRIYGDGLVNEFGVFFQGTTSSGVTYTFFEPIQ